MNQIHVLVVDFENQLGSFQLKVFQKVDFIICFEEWIWNFVKWKFLPCSYTFEFLQDMEMKQLQKISAVCVHWEMMISDPVS